MEKTNFTFVPALKWMLCSLVLVLGYGLSAQSITCNNGVQVSVNPTPNACQVEITADMILEGDPTSTYTLAIVNGITPVYNGSAPAILNGVQPYFGSSLTVTITDDATGNSCWGAIIIEDKLAPVITCTDVAVNCDQNLPNVGNGVSAVDNCDNNPDIQLTDEVYTDNDICDVGAIKIVVRTYVAFDNQGNESATCQQTITINRIAPVFPADRIWDCTDYANFPNIINPTTYLPNPLSLTGSGFPFNLNGNYEACNYAVTSSDEVLPTCGYDANINEPVFKIVRTWTVLDWCTSAVISSNASGDAIQVIKVLDTTPPAITMGNVTVSANVPGQHPQPCASTSFVPAPTITDNCTDVVSLSIYTPAGELNYIGGNALNGGWIPSPGLAVGDHVLTYTATDACGNVGTLNVTLSVVDDIAPAAICDEITDVNLSSDGQAIVYASTFDDGSSDNCCIEGFEVRRMDNPECPGNDATAYAPTVPFTCCDVNSTVMVELKVTDCYGNANTCMVEVNVQDKLSPWIQCPGPATITCDQYWDDYEALLLLCEQEADEEECQDQVLTPDFGAPTYYDNCEAIVTPEVEIDLDQCGDGTITRSWSATDPSGNAPASCEQVITVIHVSDWAVMFPDDKYVNCEGTVPDFGEPVLYFETCELLAVSYADEIYTTVPDACYKLVRQWTVINWCTVGDNIDQQFNEPSECAANTDYNGNGINCTTNNPLNNPAFIVGHSHRTFRENTNAPDGYITYQQVIKVNDNEVPVFVDCSVEDMCIYDGCTMTVFLPEPTVTDCSEEITVTVESTTMSTGSGYGPYVNVAPGTYTVVYKATDNCGNWSVCETTFTVSDCKKPTPYCVEGLIIGIMNTSPPMVDVWASDFDAGSFDNCGVKAISFSADITDTQVVFDCDDLGEQPIQLWVTDIYDNQDFCQTFVIIQDQMDVCGTGLVVEIGGAITNEDNQPVEDVEVELSGQSSGMVMTDNTGNFNFNVPTGNDVTITPSKDSEPLNGVTTFDIVLISKHILGTQELDSPYKMIAADANNSETVTTIDVVQIRKLILQITSNFANNTSWRFVDKDHTFTNPTNPWATSIPEVINFNNIDVEQLDVDFVAVKVGDVNMSAQTVNLLGTDDRNTVGTFTLNAEDRLVKAGETVTVDFTANQEIQGYQFTLNHSSAVDFVEVNDGIAKEENFGFALLNEKAITASWNGSGINGQVAFSMTFTANADVMLSEALTVNSRYTTAEAYDVEGGVMDVELNFNNVASNFDLYQNTPNPFNGETVIGFNLPEAGTATLTVADVSGRVLTVIEGDYAKGYNQVRISNLPATGVMYYTLATANETATKKMVATK